MDQAEALKQARQRIAMAAREGRGMVFLDDAPLHDLAPLIDALAALDPPLQWLNLSSTQVADLAPLADLTALQTLLLSSTQVADLAPLAGLTALQSLSLHNTQVADLAPLAGLTALKWLDLDNTQVADLAPLAGHPDLKVIDLRSTPVWDLRPLLSCPAIRKKPDDLTQFGLSYTDSAATRADPTLAELATIKDDGERTRRTLDHLATLPPWPEPLPFRPPPIADTPPAAPAPDPGLPLTIRDGVLHLATVPHGPDDDPLRTRTFARLAQAVTALVRQGNRYPEIVPIVRSLLDQTGGTLAEASLYDIHLDVAALTDLIDGNPRRSTAEQYDPDCLSAMQAVTRLGPPLTMDDPLVLRFEESHARFKGQETNPAVQAGELRLVQSIAASVEGIDEGVKALATMIAAQPIGPGRTETARKVLTRETVVVIGITVFAGLTTEAMKAGSIAAWNAAPGLWSFLVANKDAIMAASWGWGQQAHVWTADLLARAVELSNLRFARK